MMTSLAWAALSLNLAAAPVVTQAPLPVRQATLNVLTVNPADLLSGIASIEYERVVTPWLGVSGGIAVWSFRGILIPYDQPSVVGIAPELGARFHLSSNAPGGFWLGPTAMFGTLFSRTDGELARGWSWGVALAAGYTFLLDEHLVFQLGGSSGFIDYGDRIVWSPRLRLALGVTF
ncbi:MAG: hypothetical protein ACO1OB_24785 [Archangium sp.]